MISCAVRITPKFPKSRDFNESKSAEEKSKLELRLSLVVANGATWVKAPEFLALYGAGRDFQVKVDPTQIAAGTFAYTEVQGFDVSCLERGPVFRVPVSVCRPAPTPDSRFTCNDLVLERGGIYHKFIHVPAGATLAGNFVT